MHQMLFSHSLFPNQYHHSILHFPNPSPRKWRKNTIQRIVELEHDTLCIHTTRLNIKFASKNRTNILWLKQFERLNSLLLSWYAIKATESFRKTSMLCLTCRRRQHNFTRATKWSIQRQSKVRRKVRKIWPLLSIPSTIVFPPSGPAVPSGISRRKNRTNILCTPRCNYWKSLLPNTILRNSQMKSLGSSKTLGLGWKSK